MTSVRLECGGRESRLAPEESSSKSRTHPWCGGTGGVADIGTLKAREELPVPIDRRLFSAKSNSAQRFGRCDVAWSTDARMW